MPNPRVGGRALFELTDPALRPAPVRSPLERRHRLMITGVGMFRHDARLAPVGLAS
jgi:hypothetical protein